MSIIDGFLDRLEVFFPRTEGLEILGSWTISYDEISRVATNGLPTVNLTFPMEYPRMLEFWESFYLTALRQQGSKGCSLMVRHLVNQAAIELLLMRKK